MLTKSTHSPHSIHEYPLLSLEVVVQLSQEPLGPAGLTCLSHGPEAFTILLVSAGELNEQRWLLVPSHKLRFTSVET